MKWSLRKTKSTEPEERPDAVPAHASQVTPAQNVAAIILTMAFLSVAVGGGYYLRTHSGRSGMGGMGADTGKQSGGAAKQKGESTQTVGDLTVTLRFPQLKRGASEGVLEFRKGDQPVEVKNVKLALAMNMPGMVMHDNATVKTSSPGSYQVTANPSMVGDWMATVSFDGPQGNRTAKFKLTAQ